MFFLDGNMMMLLVHRFAAAFVWSLRVPWSNSGRSVGAI
ncbi:MAG: hypothetical protein ACI83P_001445 [Janthinobacterium sp.]|jgi:hypothetical protein